MFNLFISMMLIFSNATMACTEDGRGGFMEDNDHNIPANSAIRTGLSEEQFNAVIDKVEAVYLPIASSMGGKLTIHRRWEDGKVNASASRFLSSWSVMMYGGLARHKAITEDGFAIVLCHELGHLVGGAPRVNDVFKLWASNEGQADYFASLKCLRKVFLNDNNDAIVTTLKAPETLVKNCKKQHTHKADKNICIRIGMAAASVAQMFADLRGRNPAQFDTPDQTVVTKTNHSHPRSQCRLDTYYQGALCEVSMNEDVSHKDEVKGACHKSLGHEVGLRPLCWFKPKVN